MNRRSGHKRSMPKRTAKKERKGKKSTRGYRKGSKSKTMKGEKDFTTKKTSKVFNRRKHYQKHAKGSRVNRRPYHKKGGKADIDKAYKSRPQILSVGISINSSNYKPSTGPTKGYPEGSVWVAGESATGLVAAMQNAAGSGAPKLGLTSGVLDNTTANIAHMQNEAAQRAYKNSLAKYSESVHGNASKIRTWKYNHQPATSMGKGNNYFFGTGTGVNTDSVISLGANSVKAGQLLDQPGFTGGDAFKAYLEKHPNVARDVAKAISNYATTSLSENPGGPPGGTKWSAAPLTGNWKAIYQQLVGKGGWVSGVGNQFAV